MKSDLPCLEQDTLLINSRMELPCLLFNCKGTCNISKTTVNLAFNLKQDSCRRTVFVLIMARTTKELYCIRSQYQHLIYRKDNFESKNRATFPKKQGLKECKVILHCKYCKKPTICHLIVANIVLTCKKNNYWTQLSTIRTWVDINFFSLLSNGINIFFFDFVA